MRKIKFATLVLLLLLPGLAFKASPVKAAGNPSASGHGTVVDGDTVRFISFNAVQHDDLTVTGQAELQNFNQEIRIHLELDCLRLNGNVANMSGIVTESNIPDLIGLRGVFRVEDNGEGGEASPDRLSRLFLGGPDCSTTVPLGLAPIIRGNIQVRQ